MITGPPPELRGDVLRALRFKAQSDTRKQFFAWFAPIWAVTVVVVFIVALAVFLSASTNNKQKSIPELVRLAVDNYEGYLRHQVALDLESNDPATVSRWFQERVGFPVNLPSEVARGLRIKGGKIVPFGDLQLAFVAYELGGEKVSLVMTASLDSDRLLGEGGVSFRGRTFHRGEYRGYSTISWNHGGLSYILVSKSSEKVNQACVICHGSPAGMELIEEFTGKKI